jgi:hypothetical protein
MTVEELLVLLKGIPPETPLMIVIRDEDTGYALDSVRYQTGEDVDGGILFLKGE